MFRSKAVLRKSTLAHSTARSDARRPDRPTQDRSYCRHLGHDHRAAPVPRIERSPACLDSERALDRGHGFVGRVVNVAPASTRLQGVVVGFPPAALGLIRKM